MIKTTSVKQQSEYLICSRNPPGILQESSRQFTQLDEWGMPQFFDDIYIYIYIYMG